MTSNFIHLLSDTPCTMTANGNYLGELDNINTFEFDIITNANNLFVEYNPISQDCDFLPYTINVNCLSQVYSYNKNIQIIPFTNNHYDIIFSPYKYYSQEKTELIFSKNIGKYYISITNSNKSTISIFSSSSLLLTKTCDKIYNANVDVKKDILILQGIKSDDEYYILIFDGSSANIIFEDFVHSIDLNDNYIEVLKNLKDISHHALVCKVDFNDKSSQKYYVYENNICMNPSSQELIPQDFLECLLIGDDAKAYSHLNANLQSTDIRYFQSYFGKYSHICLNRHNISNSKLNYTIIGEKTRNYNFVMDDNKIVDIEEVF